MLRTWLSSLLRPDGAGVLLLPPAHLPALPLRPVRGQRRLFPGFGPVAAAFGAPEVEQAGGRCVARLWKGWDGAAEKGFEEVLEVVGKREVAQRRWDLEDGVGVVVVMLWVLS